MLASLWFCSKLSYSSYLCAESSYSELYCNVAIIIVIGDHMVDSQQDVFITHTDEIDSK